MPEVGDIYCELKWSVYILLLSRRPEEDGSRWLVLFLNGVLAGQTTEYENHDIVNWYEKVA